MNTKEIRKDMGMTQKQFAEEFSIPLGTVQNWDARDCMPSYMYMIFAKYVHLKNENESLRHIFLGE